MVDYADTVKVRIDPRGADRAPVVPKDISDKMRSAGWSADPGTGKAVLLEDGRELVNPLPHDPPLGYVQEPSVIDLINRELAKRKALLEADEVLDETDEDANDFDMEDEVDLLSGYEIVDMRPTFPGDTGIPPDKSEIKKAVADATAEAEASKA